MAHFNSADYTHALDITNAMLEESDRREVQPKEMGTGDPAGA